MSQSIGFGAKVSSGSKNIIDQNASSTKVTELDLIQFGLIPEFVGRVPLIVPVQQLSRKELVRILSEPKNSLVGQYIKLFSSWNVDLKFENGALETLATRVMERQTGARGLRFLLEELLKDAMYMAPRSDIKSIKIDDNLRANYMVKDSIIVTDTPLTESHRPSESESVGSNDSVYVDQLGSGQKIADVSPTAQLKRSPKHS